MLKTTKYQMFDALINYITEGRAAYETNDEFCEVGQEALIEFCQREQELLTKKAAKARELARKKKSESDELQAKVEQALADEFESIAAITDKIDDPDATTAKVTYRLTKLVSLGIAEKSEINVAPANSKSKRKVMGYRRIQVNA